MPVYEFYCPDCHTIFNFFSRRVNTAARPACPRCERPELERQVSSSPLAPGARMRRRAVPCRTWMIRVWNGP